MLPVKNRQWRIFPGEEFNVTPAVIFCVGVAKEFSSPTVASLRCSES